MRSRSQTLIASCLTSLSLMPAAYAGGERLLTGEELQLLFPGLVAHFDRGVNTKELKYLSDGRLERSVLFKKQVGPTSGKWRIKGNKMCFRWSAWPDSKPDQCNRFGLEGVTDTVNEIDFGALKGKQLLVFKKDGSILNKAKIEGKKSEE